MIQLGLQLLEFLVPLLNRHILPLSRIPDAAEHLRQRRQSPGACECRCVPSQAEHLHLFLSDSPRRSVERCNRLTRRQIPEFRDRDAEFQRLDQERLEI